MNNKKDREKKLESNLWKMKLYMILYSFVFYIPIIVLFYQDNGLSMTQIMTLQSLSSLLFLLLEIPSGYFADVFGRKKSLLITGISAASAMAVFAIGTNIFHFLAACLLWALAGSFISGADSALVYDTLLELKKENLFKKSWGSIVFYYSLGASLASIFGGWMGRYDYRYTFYAAIPFMLLLIPLSLSFSEPQKNRSLYVKNYFFEVGQVLTRTILINVKLRGMFLYSAVIVGFISISYFLYQPYFKLSGIDVAWFGMIFAGLNIISAISSRYTHFIESRIGPKNSLLLLVILLGGSYILMGRFVSLFSFFFAIMIQFAKGFSSILISDYINQSIDSHARATILSAKSLVDKIFYAAAIPLVGWATDVYSLSWALILSGIFILVSGLIILIFIFNSPKPGHDMVK